jgi:hypothetical protein
MPNAQLLAKIDASIAKRIISVWTRTGRREE